ncbi:unnamed protein product [Mytilus coruscus]|uniref:SGNH hydrolase-type esterase domain-containing protein n=1 Tax=Mytilus coruscus TaxID=42192 RepID=A0A6J8DQ40_MYTCO|nr:unnamed protein product [Mytilus coruscus]
MKPPKRPRNVPKKISQQPAGPAKKFRKGKVPSTRGALSESQNTTRTIQVSRTATGSNLPIASGPDEMDIESPNCNEGNALDRPGGALLPLTPQPGPSGVKSPANNNLGMLTVSNQFVSHGSAGSGSLDTRLQVDQSPSYIASVFDPISSHIPVKIKEKIWNGYTHLYSLGNSPINVDEVKKALINYPHQEVARDLIQGLEAGFKLKYSGPRLPMDIDSKEMNWEKATIARDKIFKEINLGSKAIWFVGSSIVYWAQINAKTRNGGPNIGLQSRGVDIRWFGKRGMLWNEFNAKVSHAVDKFSPPAMIVIQLGSNDLVKVKTLELIQNIERDILRLHLLLPNTRIVWSEMLLRSPRSVCNSQYETILFSSAFSLAYFAILRVSELAINSRTDESGHALKCEDITFDKSNGQTELHVKICSSKNRSKAYFHNPDHSEPCRFEYLSNYAITILFAGSLLRRKWIK